MAINKAVATFDEAVADIADGSLLHLGGFAGPGECPSYLIAALVRRGVKDLTVTGNLGGMGLTGLALMRERMRSLVEFPEDFYDLGVLIERGQVRKGILAFPAAPGSMEWPFEQKLRAGEIELELLGQGSLAERIRCARAGLAGVYTPVGVGTVAAEGKEIREFNGVPHVLETALKADYSVIRAHKADRRGNLVYKGTGRTFNATMAGAANVTIAEVDEVVELGELDPECIVTPGLYVDRVVVRPSELKRWDEPC
ncbi:MAG: 3-oxoacid CoA-transferase subunit A [Dehalococcoidia bacterium]